MASEKAREWTLSGPAYVWQSARNRVSSNDILDPDEHVDVIEKSALTATQSKLDEALGLIKQLEKIELRLSDNEEAIALIADFRKRMEAP